MTGIEIFYITLAVSCILAVSFGLGRVFGGAWMVVFLVVMAVAGLTLGVMLATATGRYGGLGEMIFLMFVWAPVLVCGLIGSGVGWAIRARKTAIFHASPKADDGS